MNRDGVIFISRLKKASMNLEEFCCNNCVFCLKSFVAISLSKFYKCSLIFQYININLICGEFLSFALSCIIITFEVIYALSY